MDRNSKISIAVVAIVVVVVVAVSAAIVLLPKEKTSEQKYMEDLQFKCVHHYFYYVDYTKVGYDYEYGFKYCKEHYGPKSAVKLPGCSSISIGDLYGRNFDWTINDSPYYIIRTGAVDGRHATIGMGTFISGVEDKDVYGGRYTDRYLDLPFFTTDGINDAGLIVSMNVSDRYDARTTGTNPGMKDMSAVMIVRYILDNASTVDDAIKIFEAYNIYCPGSEAFSEQTHYLISDAKGNSVIVEFEGNKLYYLYDEHVLTNFNIASSFYDENGKCTVNQKERLTYERKLGNKIFENLPGCCKGIERYVILLDNYLNNKPDTVDKTFDLMKKVYYTNTFTKKEYRWYSELYCRPYDRYASTELFNREMDYVHKMLDEGIGAGWIWKTEYSAIYDRSTMTIHIAMHENSVLSCHIKL